MNNKYSPGDKITCEFTVKTVVGAPTNIKVEGRGMWVPRESIIKHEPKPWVPEIGEKVRFRTSGALWEVLGVAEGLLWTRPIDSPLINPFTLKASHFEKVS